LAGSANRSGDCELPTTSSHGGGDVLFGEADQRGQASVDIDVEGRLLKSLLDARIGEPGMP